MTVTDDPAAATTRDGGEPVAACDAVLRHVVDVHCHPTDSPATLSPDSMHRLPITICPMASRKSDQPRVRALAQAHPYKVIPGFGQLLAASFPLLDDSCGLHWNECCCVSDFGSPT